MTNIDQLATEELSRLLEDIKYLPICKNIKVLEELSKDEENFVRRAVGVNLATPIKVLVNLSKDASWYVRSIVTEQLRSRFVDINKFL